MVIAPARRAGDPGSNPGSGDKFLSQINYLLANLLSLESVVLILYVSLYYY